MSEIVLPFGKKPSGKIESASSMAEAARLQKQIEQAQHGILADAQHPTEEAAEHPDKLYMDMPGLNPETLDRLRRQNANRLEKLNTDLGFPELLSSLEDALVGRDIRSEYREAQAEYRMHNDISVDENTSFPIFQMKLAHYVMFLEDKIFGVKLNDMDRAAFYANQLCIAGSGATRDADECYFRAKNVFNSMHETIDFMTEGHMRQKRGREAERLLIDKLSPDRDVRERFIHYTLTKYGIDEPMPLELMAGKALDVVNSLVHTRERFREVFRAVTYRN